MGDKMFVNLFIQDSISSIDILYTYIADENMGIEVGTRVKVPFGKGNRQEIGIVMEKNVHYNGRYKVKSIIEVIDDEPIINKDLVELGYWMTKRYLIGFNSAFSPILPPGDFKKIEKHAYIINNEYKTENEDINKLLIKISKNSLVDQLDNNSKKLLQKLREDKIISLKFKIRTMGGFKTVKMVKLKNKDIINVLKGKQKDVCDYLLNNGDSRKKQIQIDLGISDSPINTLFKNNIIDIYDEIEERQVYNEDFKCDKHDLNEDQLFSYNGILSSKNNISLLHGLTGSGKTEVYLHLAEKIINDNGQVIVLVPEIGLTPQMIERFKGRFKKRVSVLHSKLSSGERFDQWQKIKNGEVDIVIGVRSAIFAPFDNLKLIIVDEEHDSSYRFHDSLKYDTVEIAIKRSEMNNAKVVLGSATPDVTHYYKALRGEYNLFRLNTRAKENASIPDIKITDMREELNNGNRSIFSEELARKIYEKLSRKETVILFLNRRGFSTFISCRNCGEVIKCDNCDIAMTYHKNMGILRCHYCGATKKMILKCPKCGSRYIKQFGIGTQRVEEETKKIFPDARVLRMDRDTTYTKNAYDEIYAKLKNKEVDILIGTQMLAKGLDFENVTLVGVIAADLSLYMQDFRAYETTFQLLTQVSGRAGRGGKKGEVFIQTYNPESFVFDCVKDTDYNKFYKDEIKLRESFKYPPFRGILSLGFSSQDYKNLDFSAYKILMDIRKEAVNLNIEHTNLISSPKINNVYKVKFTIKYIPEDLYSLNNLLKRVLIKNKSLLEKNKVYYSINYL